MARLVEWSDDAVMDVEELATYIAASSPQNARSVVRKVREAAENLPNFPYAHRIVPEWQDPDWRETFVYRWRLIYRVLPDRIRIVGVIHGSRLLGNIDDRSFEEGPQAEYRAS
jgi:toxin ParE1/3/4